MKVELNIENDEALRQYIKDAIKGQVMSIAREEFLEIVRTELNRKVKGMSAGHFDEMLKQTMKLAVLELLRDQHGITKWNREFIKPYIDETIGSFLEGLNIEYLVNQAASAKIFEMSKTPTVLKLITKKCPKKRYETKSIK